ncbi:hypothetical protein SteCoe_33458 [Stentor coeruleus]|uniref:PLAC8 family protein n=1 Tax=Stentor coeruleus TaxID=5963 RepID=A0A1R2AWS2_9CILI|nr:hypothetical protein SteCoe_33458 [Stentor coeruleus]
MSFQEQLCGCLSDMFSCLIVWYVPFGSCVMHAMATNQITNSGFMESYLISLACCFGMAYNRQKIKKVLMIQGNYFEDCLMYFCCMACATAQDYREAETRYLANP